MEHSGKIETKISTIYIDDCGILVIEQKKNKIILPEDFTASIRHYSMLCKERKRPCLLVVGTYADFPQESLKFNSPEKQNALFLAQAIVLTDLPQRILFNSYLKTHHAAYPRKIFRSRKKAEQWLRTYL